MRKGSIKQLYYALGDVKGGKSVKFMHKENTQEKEQNTHSFPSLA